MPCVMAWRVHVKSVNVAQKHQGKDAKPFIRGENT